MSEAKKENVTKLEAPTVKVKLLRDIERDGQRINAGAIIDLPQDEADDLCKPAGEPMFGFMGVREEWDTEGQTKPVLRAKRIVSEA